MESDDSTTPSQSPRMPAVVLGTEDTDNLQFDGSRPSSPAPATLLVPVHGETVVQNPHSRCAFDMPQILLADNARLVSTIEPPTFLNQPRLAPYTGTPSWAARSDYNDAVANKTNVQITTTAAYIMRVLGLRVSLAMPDYSTHPRYDDVAITEEELRAVYMKALVWFVERECLNGGSHHVVFVGGVDAKCPDGVPAVPLDDLRSMAEQLPEDHRDSANNDNFEAFMFHAGAYFVEHHGWTWAFVAGLLMIAGAVTLVLTLRFLFTRSLLDTMRAS